MSTLYLLDTNILVHLIRDDTTGQHIRTVYNPLMVEPCPLISVVTTGELRSLIYQFHWGRNKADQALFLLNYFKEVPIHDRDIIEAYATMDAYSEAFGRSMGKNDLWIAATAKVTGATILTTDKDFDHLSPQFLHRILIASD